MIALVMGCDSNEAAAPVRAESQTTGTRLVELYTSQGCSSCPPAEAWVGRLAKHSELWKSIVPVVFHVDYWDRLGWKDPFASPRYTARQYGYQAWHKMRSVYTPGFFVDGKEWPGFFQQAALPEAQASQVSLAATWDAGLVEVEPTGMTTSAKVFVALLGSNLRTSIKRGENEGRRLESHFVVMSLKTEDYIPDQTIPTRFIFDRPAGLPEKTKFAFATWLTSMDSPLPIVSAGQWLPSQAF